MDRKICFFDLDGTLLSHQNNRVPASTVHSFSILHEKRIPCILCSGRSFPELDELKQVHDLHFDGYILLTGAYAADAMRQPLFVQAIDADTIGRTIAYLDAHHLAAVFTNARGSWMNRHTQRVVEVQKQIHTEPFAVGDMKRIHDGAIYQITVYAKKKEAENLLAEIPTLRSTWWHPLAFDLTDRHASKGFALRKMCTHMGYAAADAVAFGDGNNDVDMMEAAGLGIAMGNGSVDCKAAADYVTADIDDDGIYRALKHFGLVAC